MDRTRMTQIKQIFADLIVLIRCVCVIRVPFMELRLRKLFGTVVRNTKGDWLITLPSNSTKIIYADISQIFEMDIDRPFEL